MSYLFTKISYTVCLFINFEIVCLHCRNDPDSPAAYHPFYITDDKEGGYQYKKPEQRRRVRVFAGIGKNYVFKK